MPRPKKCRKICAMPKRCGFGPVEGVEGMEETGAGQPCCAKNSGLSTRRSEDGGADRPEGGPENGDNIVEMTLDEYETIRLIDLLGYTQETCAKQMGVARTTVQAVYNEARKKLAQSLIEGRFLRIKGGNYIVCPRAESCKNKRGSQYENCSYIK